MFLKDWLFERLAWIDAQWYGKGECSTSTNLLALNDKSKTSIVVYPNPSDFSSINIQIQLKKSGAVSIHLYNTQGSLVAEQLLGHAGVGTSSFSLTSLSHLKTGLYIYKVVDGTDILGIGKIMKQ